LRDNRRFKLCKALMSLWPFNNDIFYFIFGTSDIYRHIDIRYQKLQKQSAFFGGTSDSLKLRRLHPTSTLRSDKTILPLIIIFNFDTDYTMKRRLFFLSLACFYWFFSICGINIICAWRHLLGISSFKYCAQWRRVRYDIFKTRFL